MPDTTTDQAEVLIATPKVTPIKPAMSGVKLDAKNVDWRFNSILIAVAVISVLFIAYLIYVGNIAPMIFAGTSGKASITKSLIFAYPLTIAQNDGVSDLKAFIVSEDGYPVPNKRISLFSTLGEVTPSSVETDVNGYAKFAFKSASPGTASIQIVADQKKLSQKVTVKVE